MLLTLLVRFLIFFCLSTCLTIFLFLLYASIYHVACIFICLLRYSDIKKILQSLAMPFLSKQIVTLITLPEKKLSEKTLKFTLILFLLLPFAKGFHTCAPQTVFGSLFSVFSNIPNVFIVKDLLEKYHNVSLNVVKTSPCNCYES